MLRNAYRLCTLVFVVILCQVSAAFAGKRVALLIGNTAYQALAPMRTPVNNVAAMKAAMEKAGFAKVTAVFDLGFVDTIKALHAFEDDIDEEKADVAVIYYSGHGVEVTGTSFAVPIDATLKAERDIEHETVAIDRMWRAIEGVNAIGLIIIDASRDNPFKGAREYHDLTMPEADPRQSVFYATREGRTVTEGDGSIDPFTQALLSQMFRPDRTITEAALAVGDQVKAATGGKQLPSMYRWDTGKYSLAK